MSLVTLVYCKSKVYVHPSKDSKENVPGFLYIYRDTPTASDRELQFGWIAESLLSPTDLAKYQEFDLNPNSTNNKVKRPSSAGSFSFTVHVGELFSIQKRPPSLGWWYGSIIINTHSPHDRLPVLFFHDDECESTVQEQNRKNKDFDPFGDDNELFWGGNQFLNELKKHANLVKSTLEDSILLVNPTSDDLNNFSPTNIKNKPKHETDFKLNFDFNSFLSEARWSVLETLAKVTKFTKNHVNDVLDDSPLPIKKLLKNPDVMRVNEDFDTARVYLANWAMGVQEQASKSRKKIILDSDSREMLSKELGLNFDRLLPEEILNAHERSRELTQVEWSSYLDHTGRLTITTNELKDKIFHGGVNEVIRNEVWVFLLGVYPWDSSYQERKDIRAVLEKEYLELKKKWVNNLEELKKDDYFKDQVFRIEKDIQRTDRNLPIFKHQQNELDEDNADFKISNPHLLQMKEILLTFNQYNDKLGYVQGMTDLLSPIYVTLQDSTLAFWCFTKFMDRMERNFLHDQSGMKDQMNTLNELVQFMLPDLYIHLEKCDSNNLFFFFRMLLVWFKREFPWDEVLRLWEVLWTDFYSSQFHLFFALAILQKNEKIIIDHLRQFDEVLKYINDLSMTYNLNDLLTRSELLFLKFRKMIEIIDRESTDDSLSPISDNLRGLLSKDLVIKKELERHVG